MTVFHGSNVQVVAPDLSKSKRFIDFGPGFYVTTIRRQAERWAARKAARSGGAAIVNEYGLKSDWTGFRVLNFNGASKEWLDFVCACRKGELPCEDYDIISGKVADDKVYEAVDMYRRGVWDVERTLKEIAYYEDSNQIVLRTPEAISSLLVFSRSYEVKS